MSFGLYPTYGAGFLREVRKYLITEDLSGIKYKKRRSDGAWSHKQLRIIISQEEEKSRGGRNILYDFVDFAVAVRL